MFKKTIDITSFEFFFFFCWKESLKVKKVGDSVLTEDEKVLTEIREHYWEGHTFGLERRLSG